MTKSLVSSPKKSFINQIIIGAIISLSVTLVLILIFALIIKFTNLPNGFLMPINQLIKITSLIIGCCIGFRNDKTKGFIKGLFIGMLYSILSYIIFSFLSGSFSFSFNTILDLLFVTIIGSICGILCVNLSKR